MSNNQWWCIHSIFLWTWSWYFMDSSFCSVFSFCVWHSCGCHISSCFSFAELNSNSHLKFPMYLVAASDLCHLPNISLRIDDRFLSLCSSASCGNWMWGLCLSESISICCKLWAVKSMSYPWNAESLSPWSWINWGRMQLLDLTIGSIVWANHGLLSSIPPHLSSLSLPLSVSDWADICELHLEAQISMFSIAVFFFENRTMHLIRWVSCLSYAWMCSKFVCALLMACWPIWEAYEKCFVAQLTKWCLQVTVYTILTKIGITYNIKSNNM